MPSVKVGIIFFALVAFSLLAFRERESSLDGQLRNLSGRWERAGSEAQLFLQCEYTAGVGVCKASLSGNRPFGGKTPHHHHPLIVSRLRGGGLLLVERDTNSAPWTLIHDGSSPLLLLDLETGISWRRSLDFGWWRSTLYPVIINAKYYSSLVAILLLAVSARGLIFPRTGQVHGRRQLRKVMRTSGGTSVSLKKQQ